MHTNVKWKTTLDRGTIWRVLPLGDRLVVGLGGTWRDQNAMWGGPRGQITVGASDDVGSTIILDCDGKVVEELPGIAPIQTRGAQFIGLRGQHEIVLCSSRGAVEASAEPLDLQHPIRAVASLGTRVLVMSSEPLTPEQAEADAPATLRKCECVVVDPGLNACERFRVDELVMQTASERSLFWHEYGTSTIRRANWLGQNEAILNLAHPAIEGECKKWVDAHNTLYVKGGHWALSYDYTADRLLASRLYPPHVVAAIEPDGRIAWCRAVHGGCCAGPVRRIGDLLVVASGCGGVVSWLNEHGELVHQSQDKLRKAQLDPIHPTDIEPGPHGCVLAFRSDRLVSFHPDGSEYVILEMGDATRPTTVTWWEQLGYAICWDDRTISLIAAGT